MEQRNRFPAEQRSTVLVPPSLGDACQPFHRQRVSPRAIKPSDEQPCAAQTQIAIFRQLLRGWRARPVSVVPCQLSTTRSLVLGIFLGVTLALDRSTKQQI